MTTTTLKTYSEEQEQMITASGYRVKGRSKLGGMAVSNLAAVMAAAAKTARRDRKTMYVYATANGYSFGPDRPPFNQRHYEMTAEGYRMID